MNGRIVKSKDPLLWILRLPLLPILPLIAENFEETLNYYSLESKCGVSSQRFVLNAEYPRARFFRSQRPVGDALLWKGKKTTAAASVMRRNKVANFESAHLRCGLARMPYHKFPKCIPILHRDALTRELSQHAGTTRTNNIGRISVTQTVAEHVLSRRILEVNE